MKLFWFEYPPKPPKVDPLPTMIAEELQRTRIALFEARLEKDTVVAAETQLMSRLDWLRVEQAEVEEKLPRLHNVK